MQKSSALFCLLFFIGCLNPAMASKRVALVVGNAKYVHSTPLKNPVNDATAMAASLRRLNFDVIEALDVTNSDLANVLSRFQDKLQDADVGLFFYAGHGISFKGENYIIPVDARLDNAFRVRQETFSINEILHEMAQLTRLNMIFLDACRDNPLAQKLKRSLARSRSASVGRGLSLIKPQGKESLIVFATEPGEVAADGATRHSPFTEALLRHIERPGVDVEIMLKAVQRDVKKATRNAQRPERISKLESEFSFNPATGTKKKTYQSESWSRDNSWEKEMSRRKELEHRKKMAALQQETDYWNIVKDSSDPDIVQRYITKYPNGRYVELAEIKIASLKAAQAKPTPPPVTRTETETETSQGPTFDCSGRKSPTERAICNSTVLSKLDRQMSDRYFSARRSLSRSGKWNLKKEQRRWLKNRNDCGSNDYCIEQSYRKRIQALDLWGVE